MAKSSLLAMSCLLLSLSVLDSSIYLWLYSFCISTMKTFCLTLEQACCQFTHLVTKPYVYTYARLEKGVVDNLDKKCNACVKLS